MPDTATLSDVVDAWTEVTIVHALAREAITAGTLYERRHALDALRTLGHDDLARSLAPQVDE
jgi:hypothetical protein